MRRALVSTIISTSSSGTLASASAARLRLLAAYYAPDGELPINTHGGQLSVGRLHGYGFLYEACV
jgi:hypothetical protein